MEKLKDEGRIRENKGAKYPAYKFYLSETKGVPVGDMWVDINAIRTGVNNEALGYPTQKPEALLRRIILASSNRGDTILDPFCGCGTCVAVAEKEGREWVGIDNNKRAIQLTRKRIKQIRRNL